MSEEAKNTVPETEQPETAPEEKTAAAAPEQAAAEAATEEDKKKDGGWFNKKAREMEAVKAKLDAAEKNAAQAKDQLLRMAAEYDNYRSAPPARPTRSLVTVFPMQWKRSSPFWIRWIWQPTPPPPMKTTKRAWS